MCRANGFEVKREILLLCMSALSIMLLTGGDRVRSKELDRKRKGARSGNEKSTRSRSQYKRQEEDFMEEEHILK